MFTYTFTVFTPTYNRAHTLPRVFQSLCQQTVKDFEWIIVDDGSMDQTPTLVANWIREAPFPIRYLTQPNSGKHVAFNRAVSEARGRLFTTLDSDDAFLPNALERLAFHWNQIPDSDKSQFVGVACRCQYTNGKVVGTPFPKDIFHSSDLEVRLRWRGQGDRKGCNRTEILRQFPFPVIEGERFMSEAVIWNRIALHYQKRFVNEVLAVVEYRSDGLSAAFDRIRVQSPQSALIQYQELLNMPIAMPLDLRMRNYANYIRFSCHAGRPWADLFGQVPSKLLLCFTLPLGLLLVLKDRLTMGRGFSDGT